MLEPFDPTWESLRKFECPEWFRDAKLGIWSHWGPQSVPMYGDWYARHLYVEGHDQYLHHWRTYGHPSKHGWKDVVPLWKAEAFDLLYSDSHLPFGEIGLRAVAHLYNTSAAGHGGINRAVYNQKSTEPDMYRVGVLDIERGARSDIAEDAWQTDTCVGGWFYDVRRKYKSPTHVIEMFVDIVSKNGNLLLNFPQKPDGTLDDECGWILRKMGEWIAVNGEGIYATRPWKIAGEGATAGEAGKFKEDALEWTPADFRFTSKGDVVYAFGMRWPEDGHALVKALAAGAGPKVAKVSLLGSGDVKFEQDADGLRIEFPEQRPCEFVHCFRVRTGT